MSFKNKYVNVIDWAGNNLFNGPFDSDELDVVLDANRCNCYGFDYEINCIDCDNTGYVGEFEVLWEDESDKDDCNVYEYVNY